MALIPLAPLLANHSFTNVVAVCRFLAPPCRPPDRADRTRLRRGETFDPEELLARLLMHIPASGEGETAGE